MASSGSKHKMSEETFDYICTSCAADNLTKEAIKYCVVCQLYCCHDCVTAHKKLPILKGHTLLDNYSGSSLERRSSLPAFPTEQCSIHNGKILDMYCGNHNVVGCYVCVAMDHKSCRELYSVTDNIDKLYKTSDTDQTKSDLASMLHTMNERRNVTHTLLQQLRDSKTNAVQAVKDFRSEMDKHLDKLEDESIKELERDYRKMESELLEKRKIYEKFIDELKKLDNVITQSEGNTAQMFVCSQRARQKIMSTETEVEKVAKRQKSFVMSFIPVAELRKFVEGLTSLGKSSLTESKHNDLYDAKKISVIHIKLKNDHEDCSILGSCIVDDTVLITDYMNNKLKRMDVSTLSIIDSCEVSDSPRAMCRVGTQEVAVACKTMVQFVSVHSQLSLSRQLKIKHKCYGIAHKNDKLYITDQTESLYVYNMIGILLRKIIYDRLGQPLSRCINHIIFSDSGDTMFVSDDRNGLLCFDTNCDHVMTIKDRDAKADGVCVDGRGNVLLANLKTNTVAQFSQDGQKRGVVVSKNDCLSRPRSVCFHQRLNRMFISNVGNKVQVYELCCV